MGNLCHGIHLRPYDTYGLDALMFLSLTSQKLLGIDHQLFPVTVRDTLIAGKVIYKTLISARNQTVIKRFGSQSCQIFFFLTSACT